MKKATGSKYLIFWAVVGAGLCIFISMKTLWPQQEMKRQISPDLLSFLEDYFSSWSKRDIESYRDHFYEQAVIMFTEKGQVRQLQSLDAFIEDQGDFLSTVKEPIVEQMTSFTADQDNKAASVCAQWSLIKGHTKKKGVDRFTLIRDLRGQWKIVCLVWYVNE